MMISTSVGLREYFPSPVTQASLAGIEILPGEPEDRVEIEPPEIAVAAPAPVLAGLYDQFVQTVDITSYCAEDQAFARHVLGAAETLLGQDGDHQLPVVVLFDLDETLIGTAQGAGLDLPSNVRPIAEPFLDFLGQRASLGVATARNVGRFFDLLGPGNDLWARFFSPEFIFFDFPRSSSLLTLGHPSQIELTEEQITKILSALAKTMGEETLWKHLGRAIQDKTFRDGDHSYQERLSRLAHDLAMYDGLMLAQMLSPYSFIPDDPESLALVTRLSEELAEITEHDPRFAATVDAAGRFHEFAKRLSDTDKAAGLCNRSLRETIAMYPELDKGPKFAWAMGLLHYGLARAVLLVNDEISNYFPERILLTDPDLGPVQLAPKEVYEKEGIGDLHGKFLGISHEGYGNWRNRGQSRQR